MTSVHTNTHQSAELKFGMASLSFITQNS